MTKPPAQQTVVRSREARDAKRNAFTANRNPGHGLALKNPEPEPKTTPVQGRPRAGGVQPAAPTGHVSKGLPNQENVRAATEDFGEGRDTKAEAKGAPGYRRLTNIWSEATGVKVQWRKADASCAKSLLTVWPDPKTLEAFVRFAIREWPAIIATEFDWMEEPPPPAQPSIRFLSVFRDEFTEAWAKGGPFAGLKEADRAEAMLMVAEGKTEAQAVAVIRQRQADHLAKVAAVTAEHAKTIYANWEKPGWREAAAASSEREAKHAAWVKLVLSAPSDAPEKPITLAALPDWTPPDAQPVAPKETT